MANFNLSIQYVLENEGGYVNDPDDPGLATNYGISLPVLSAVKKAPVTPDDVKNLSVEDAINIYYNLYYTPMRLMYVHNNNIATALLDTAVNMGLSEAKIIVHKTLIKLLADGGTFGTMDDMTIEALNDVRLRQDVFIDAYEIFVMNHYNDIVLKNPKMAKFLKGWSRRAGRLLTLK